MEPKSPSKLKLSITGFAQYKQMLKISIIVFVVVLLLIGVYFSIELQIAGNVLTRSFYTVVVDCGSSGTRVNVYEWMTSEGNNRGLPILVHSYPDNLTKNPFWKDSCQYHCMQTEPGLDKFVGNASGVGASLEPLIVWAEQLVPRERHGDTPIFVLATAGLRRLAIEDARQVLDDVEAVVKEHDFMCRHNWVRVLTGKEEAYYGWVALNYKLGDLGNSSGSPSLGLLDLGGSSLQVVMEGDNGREDDHLVRSKIRSLEHQILAYSLPAFGLNEAFDRSIVLLSQAQPLTESSRSTHELGHPCLSFDFAQNYTCYGCFGPSNTDKRNFSSQSFPSLYLVGDPNWEQCKALARAAARNSSSLDWSKPTVDLNCKASSSSYSGGNILNLTAIAHPNASFHALSGFFAVHNTLNLSSRANMTKIWEKGQELCLRSWADFSSTSGNQNYAGKYCFRVPYMASLIEDALCLGNTEIIFGPGDVSWTLGATLVEGEYLWLSTTKPQTSISALNHMEAISYPIFLFVLLLGLLLIVYCSQIKLPMPRKKGGGASLPSYVYPKCQPS